MDGPPTWWGGGKQIVQIVGVSSIGGRGWPNLYVFAPLVFLQPYTRTERGKTQPRPSLPRLKAPDFPSSPYKQGWGTSAFLALSRS